MNARESVGIALDALLANRLRSFLTLLGIIIGVASVISVMSVVQGLNRYVTAQLVSSGSDVFWIDKVGVEFDLTRLRDRLRRRDLGRADAEAVARAPHVEAAVAERFATVSMRRGNRALGQIQVQACAPDYMLVDDLPLAAGRALGESDDRGHATVCVLGADLAEQLFGALDPIGREVRAGNASLVVVGVGKRKGSAFGTSQDLYALVPYGTFERLYGREGSVVIRARSRGQAAFNQAQDEARGILRARRHVAPGAPDDFEVVTPEIYLSLWRNLSGAIFIVIIGVSAISLLVGGIVIMNIMLVSVTERTREIGIRKAMGARQRDILGQFLIESTTLAACGGLIGLALGVGGALLLGWTTPLPVYVSPVAIVLGLSSATAVGVFFGAWPAGRAARQDPIEALRYE